MLAGSRHRISAGRGVLQQSNSGAVRALMSLESVVPHQFSEAETVMPLVLLPGDVRTSYENQGESGPRRMS